MERPLAGTWFDEFAPLYAGAGHRGMAPEVVDRHEVWEVAAMLGLTEPRPEPSSLPGLAGAPSKEDIEQSQIDILRRRLAADRGEGAPPEASPPSPILRAISGGGGLSVGDDISEVN